MKKVEYPVLQEDLIKKNDTDSEITKEIHSERLYGHYNQFGFYPIGRLNNWHGGIHIESSSVVRAIADGRIIAYRLTKDYLHEKDNEKNKYSNCFMLLQHNFETPKKQKLRFYSLYMHLLPKKQLEMNAGKHMPKLYAKTQAKVIKKENVWGIRAMVDDPTKRKKDIIIPLGAEVIRLLPKSKIKKEDESASSVLDWLNPFPKTKPVNQNQLGPVDPYYDSEAWFSKSKKYRKFQYERIKYQGKTYYIPTAGNRVKLLSDNKYKIIAREVYDSKKRKGAVIYDSLNKFNVNELRVEEVGTTINDVELVNEKWLKIKGKNEYLKTFHLEVKNVFKDDIVLNSVENVDFEIKAGEIIGVPSKYAFDKHSHYNAMHVEVFTDDTELKNFFDNTKGDNDRTSYEIAEGKELQQYPPAKSCDFLKQGMKVKIYDNTDALYTQIGFEDVFCDVTRNKEIVFKEKKKVPVNGKMIKKSIYTIAEKYFDSVNTQMNNVLPDKNANVYWKESKKGEARVVGYGTELSGKKYWVDSSEVIGTKDTWVTLTNDITSFYKEKPDTTKAPLSITEVIPVIKKASPSSVKDKEGKEWWFVQGRKKHKDKKGWIKKNDLTPKNPYNWQEYGWQLKEDIGTQYFYQFGDLVQDSEPHKFIKDIWELVDTDKDGVLSIRELQRAISKKEKAEILSKLICKHPNEWNTWKNVQAFKDEVNAIYKKGIEVEEEAGQKQELEKARDEKIALLENKIEKLCFWDKIKDGDIAKPKEETKTNKPKRSFRPQEPEVKKESKGIKRTFPKSSDAIYHFHPIAFVQHMKLLCGGKEDIDLRPLMIFEKQKGKSDCNDTCKRIMERMGVIAEGASGKESIFGAKYPQSYHQLANETSKRDGLVFYEGASRKAVEYLDKSLENGHPVLIGVNHTYQYRGGTGINEGTTDHYVIAVARKLVKGEQRYIFWDVGTRNGASTEWYFVLEEEFKLYAGKTYKRGNKPYTVTQIRRNINESGQVINY